jgi:hypothetical protein
VWLGWLMIAALVYSGIPPFILGRMKLPLARELHEKALQTDADINKGDWLAGLAVAPLLPSAPAFCPCLLLVGARVGLLVCCVHRPAGL